mgnify:CR=1 FL=1
MTLRVADLENEKKKLLSDLEEARSAVTRVEELENEKKRLSEESKAFSQQIQKGYEAFESLIREKDHVIKLQSEMLSMRDNDIKFKNNLLEEKDQQAKKYKQKAHERKQNLRDIEYSQQLENTEFIKVKQEIGLISEDLKKKETEIENLLAQFGPKNFTRLSFNFQTSSTYSTSSSSYSGSESDPLSTSSSS